MESNGLGLAIGTGPLHDGPARPMAARGHGNFYLQNKFCIFSGDSVLADFLWGSGRNACVRPLLLTSLIIPVIEGNRDESS